MRSLSSSGLPMFLGCLRVCAGRPLELEVGMTEGMGFDGRQLRDLLGLKRTI